MLKPNNSAFPDEATSKKGSNSWLANPTQTKRVLERFELSPKKSFGQNFLIDDNVIGRILELARISPTDVIVEVGPGIGTLTCSLTNACSHVYAIEQDSELLPVLEDTLSDNWDKLEIINNDALRVKETDFNKALLPTKLVANLPYSVAATIVLSFFQQFRFLESATVMVQKEVASRMCAQPGCKDYGAYTVKLALWAHAAGSFDVSRNCFMPAPHVDSTVIRLNRNVAGCDSIITDDKTIQMASLMADAAFFSRRKTIANSMKQFFSGRANSKTPILNTCDIPRLLERANIDPTRRGETLDVSEYVNLAICACELVQTQVC